MKTQIALFTQLAGKINRQHIQMALLLIALAMLVLGVGAPGDGGSSGGRI